MNDNFEVRFSVACFLVIGVVVRSRLCFCY